MYTNIYFDCLDENTQKYYRQVSLRPLSLRLCLCIQLLSSNTVHQYNLANGTNIYNQQPK